MTFLICFLASFLLGSIPTAYIVTKKIKGLDIRQYGSGNVGATNAFRVLGKKYGIFVFVIDFLKGAVPAWAVLWFFRENPDASLWALGAGVAAILGHIFTPFLGFKGGKGVATGAGAVFGAYPLLFLASAVGWIAVFLGTRLVSLSSLTALASLVVIAFARIPDRRVGLIFLGLFLLVSWSHRSNIGRLIKGQELKIAKKN